MSRPVEAWLDLAAYYRGRAIQRADEGAAVKLAYLVLAEHCLFEGYSDRGGPTNEVVQLAEDVSGETVGDKIAAFQTAGEPRARAIQDDRDSGQTAVDIVIRLQVDGSPAEAARYRGALECLADVMRVQAEDGLWTLGLPDAENDEGPSTFVARIESAAVQAVLIDGTNPLTKEMPS